MIYLVSGILMIVWTNQAYKAAEARGAIGRRWSSGWAVGAWFIPFANLVIPKLVINEIDRMADERLEEPIGTAWQQSRRSPLSDWWWGLYVAGSLLMGGASNGADEYAGGWLAATGVGFLVLASAGVLGAIFLRSLGRRLQRPHYSSMR